ncbi:MAG: alpha-glucan family phosphorylase [Candidatus Thermoplasmatota archaeon]|nr:alpha-glucan family phosphorylase [Candidatus Thermoplasmatota archaeon]MBU1941855.1 alpha-glucan family phosphorylase [Candidatus Thermoplasmatota archaeon]
MESTTVQITESKLNQGKNNGKPKIAYFSMEIGIDERIPTYSGGLGVLAGDTLKSCADLNVPIVGVTLLSENGYFYQKIDDEGNQIELPFNFNINDFLTLLPGKTSVVIEDRTVNIRIWHYLYKGVNGYIIPVFFLDTNVEQNTPTDREITKYLYGGDNKYRLSQEIVLGIGGVRALQSLGYKTIDKYHMNEGHAATLTLELFRQIKDLDKIRSQCVFTTHTPVAAGHDQFDLAFAKPMLGDMLPEEIIHQVTFENRLNMTRLALHFSHYVNGVAKKHREVSQAMFPEYSIDAITNGVHTPTWVSDPFQRIFDRHMPGWRSDPYTLRSAFSIDKHEIWDAHMDAKKKLIDFVNSRYNVGMNYDYFTIGFARRQTAYKRPDLLIADPGRLKEISAKVGPLQIIYAGKAHPKDTSGKEAIKKIFSFKKTIGGKINMTYIHNYDISIAKLMVAGVDLWLNTPRRPKEASGTSGMKAAHNGVPQFSTLDGWWIEGCVENITGWSIGSSDVEEKTSDDEIDKNHLYDKLENWIMPKFYDDRDNWIRTMRSCIAINASFFNTNRMIQQYVLNAYFM